ncbi:MAG: hypothetical protein JF614_06360 [Acidobacteria bacterium]|nr:hypothetical protein [Acidobacteriota bacterium]
MRRTLVAVALTSSLLTSTAGQTNLFAPLWSLLSSLFVPSTADAGAGWDPSGLTHNSTPSARTDAGAEWDPDGLTRSDAGAEWDPNG